MTNITTTVYDDEGCEYEISLPACYEVCGLCDGHGEIPNRAWSPNGDGVWTESERAEFWHDDPELAEAYFAGRHTQPCPDCRGLRVVAVVDRDNADPADLAAYDAELRAEAEYQHELRMGY